MAVLQQTLPSLFKTRYSAALRIWHWLSFLLISFTLILVLLASTMFAMKSNQSMVQEQVSHKGGTVSAEQARAVAHEYSDKLWMLHKYVGYWLCFLLLCRMIIEVVSSKEQKLSNKIKTALAFQTANRVDKHETNHYLFVKWGYVVFYILFFIMALTGLGLAYEDVPVLKKSHELFGTLHSFVQWLIYFYIVIHIVGVIRADLSNNKGIVSSMINGGEA